jgi:glycogen operon protein
VNRWLSEANQADGHREIEWLRPDGQPMTVADWHDDLRHSLAVTGGNATARLLALFNAEAGALEFTLPPGRWVLQIDSADPARDSAVRVNGRCLVQPFSAVLLALEPASA